MSPAAKGLLSVVGVAGVSAGVLLLVLSGGGGGGTRAPADDGPKVVVDNGQTPPTDPLRPDYRVELLKFLPFSQTDQNGKTVTNDAFTGNVTIVSFFFTRCTFICPALTGTLIEMMDRLKDTPARFMSFSVDPAHDTPAVLKAYAQNHNADDGRWTLLSGPKEETWGILRTGLTWGIEERPEERIILPGGGTISNIRHPAWFVLVGPDGRVLGLYQSSEEDQLQALESRVRAVAARMKK
ncbi:MAG: SCO family protein [Phycisphaerales bacterium]